MKKLLAIILALVLSMASVFALSACGGGDDDEKEKENEQEREETGDDEKDPDEEEKKSSEGLEFTSNGDGTCYVSGIGTCTDKDVVIPKVSPAGDKVTSIGYRAFEYCRSITSVEIGNGVKSIGKSAFYNCKSLGDVYYTGSEEEWIRISFVNTELTEATVHYNYVPQK